MSVCSVYVTDNIINFKWKHQPQKKYDQEYDSI